VLLAEDAIKQLDELWVLLIDNRLAGAEEARAVVRGAEDEHEGAEFCSALTDVTFADF
jgi:hypothetical protein